MRLHETCALPLLTLAPLTGCGAERPPEAPTSRAWDSAGIEIVESPAPVRGGEEAWRVHAEPMLEIGSVEGEEPYRFSLLWDAVQAPDGRIAVVEAQALEIRVFDAEGRWLTTFGGEGEGPGELGRPPVLALAPPDTLVVWDPGHRRLSRFDFEGRLLEERNLASEVGGLSPGFAINWRSWDVARDGSLLFDVPGPRDRAEGLHELTNRFVLVRDHGRTVHDLGLFPAGTGLIAARPDGGRAGMPSPFGHSTRAVLGPGAHVLAISASEGWEVRLLGPDGRIRRILRASVPRTPVEGEVMDAERAALEEFAADARLGRSVVESMFERLPVPDSLPAIADLGWDRAGNLWVLRRTNRELPTARTYDVFDSDGRWRTTARVPEAVGFILHLGVERLLAVRSNELGVPFLTVHRLEKPRSASGDGEEGP